MNQVFNLPARLVEDFPDRPLIIRSGAPFDLARAATTIESGRIVHLQLAIPGPEVGPLIRLDPSLAVDLLLESDRDYACLYDYLPLSAGRPVRMTVPLGPGTVKAVKLAVALKMPVRLALGQPEPALTEILFHLLEFYLHDQTVAQPVEFFHSLLHSFFHQEPVSLWRLMGEDPQNLRYVTDQGRMALSPRLVDLKTPMDWPAFQRLNPRPSCAGCRHLSVCQSYFKWPDEDYDCRPLQDLLDLIARAARELAADLGQEILNGGKAP